MWEGMLSARNCIIENNAAQGDSAYGGGLHGVRCDVSLYNCCVRNNTLQGLVNNLGGGMYIENTTAAHAENCSILSNTFEAIVIGNGPLTAINSIIFFNNSNGTQLLRWGSDSTNITYSNIQNGYAGTGNISTSPLLNPDHTLNAYSPCIDAGDPAPAYNDVVFYNATTAPWGSRGTVRNDMGAYGGPGAALWDSGSGPTKFVVQQPPGKKIADGGSRSFGEVSVGTGVERTFTIRNLGTATLSGLALTKNGANAADFTITARPSAQVEVGASTTFTVRFAPTTTGAKSAAIRLASKGNKDNPFDIALTGTGVTSPEIAVKPPLGSNIADGGSWNFGTVAVGKGIDRTFTIRNTGAANLTGLTIRKNGTHAADFTIVTKPVAPVVPGGSATFVVRFAPAAGGAKRAAIHIASNDKNENPFDIELTGNGAGIPEIAVQQPAGNDLVDGVSSTSFGPVTVGDAIVKTFTVTNTGTAKLTGLSIAKSGVNSGSFTVSAPRSTILAPGESTTFTVKFKTRVPGTRSASIHIASNDANENPFDIKLTGTGVALAPSIASVFGGMTGLATASRRFPDSPKVTTLTEWVGGRKYLALMVAKAPGTERQPRIVEVSPNLLDWYTGSSHTTIITDDAAWLKVRDNTPLTRGTKRYIRLKGSP